MKPMVRVVGSRNAAKVGNILVDGLLAVHMDAGKEFVGIVLLFEIHERLGQSACDRRGSTSCARGL